MYRCVLSSVVDVVGVVMVIECGGRVAINSSSPLVSSEAEVPQPTPATLLKPCRQGCDVQHFYFRRMLMTTLLIITQNITCNWRYDNHSNKSGGPISTFVDEGYDHVTSRREPLTPFPSYDQHLPTLRTSVLAVRCFSFNLRI
jgi:hypothetical protein